MSKSEPMSDAEPASDDQLATLLDDVELSEDGEQLIETLITEVESAKSEASNAYDLARSAKQRVYDVREELRETNQRLEDVRDERDQLAQEVEELRDRTGLLEQVRDASSLKIEQRAAICIQTLYNKAWKRQQADTKDKPRASMDYKAAEAALGGGISRAKIYRTFETAESLVGNSDVVTKIDEPRGSDKNTRLELRLDNGQLPSTVAGKELTPPGGD